MESQVVAGLEMVSVLPAYSDPVRITVALPLKVTVLTQYIWPAFVVPALMLKAPPAYRKVDAVKSDPEMPTVLLLRTCGIVVAVFLKVIGPPA